MSDAENPSNEEIAHAPTAGTSTEQNDNALNTVNTWPTLPPGLKLPQSLKTEGNLAANWKRFKRSWQNYAVVARLNHFEENFKAV